MVRLFNEVPEMLGTMPNVAKVDNKKFGELDINIEEVQFNNAVAKVTNQSPPVAQW